MCSQADDPSVITADERCEAFTFDGIDAKPCTRPARVDRDGHRACHQHGRLARVDWTGQSILDIPHVDTFRPWWERDDELPPAA